ncbi:UGT2B17, partial [Symbiodinium pilosum]
ADLGGSKAEVFVSAVRKLVERSNLQFHEVAGQILFRHRRSSVIQERKDFKKVAEDVSWIFRQSSDDKEGDSSTKEEEGGKAGWMASSSICASKVSCGSENGRKLYSSSRETPFSGTVFASPIQTGSSTTSPIVMLR